MPEKQHPEIELRAREKLKEIDDPNATTYKVYRSGRLRGAILPIPEDADGNRWEAVDLKGNATRHRYRNGARDHLANLP